MRTLACVFALALLAWWSTSPCLAQRPSGPRTLETLLTGEPEAPAVADASKPAGQPQRPAGRPRGTLVRPEDGVKHPDLDKAWADYDAAVTAVAENIRTAITKQFDAAAAKGDLDDAEKWQIALERFEKSGEIPTDSETKSAVGAAVTAYKKAKEELTKAYEDVVKSLTMEKRIAEAKAARDELQAAGKAPLTDSKPKPVPEERGVAQDRLSRFTPPVKSKYAMWKVQKPREARPDTYWLLANNTCTSPRGDLGRWSQRGETVSLIWENGGRDEFFLDREGKPVRGVSVSHDFDFGIVEVGFDYTGAPAPPVLQR